VEEVTWLDPRPVQPPHVAVRFLAGAGFEAPEDLLTTPLWPPPVTGDSLWIHPGSGSLKKNMRPETFAAFARDWHGREGGRVVVSFGEADRGLIVPMAAAMAGYGIPYEPVVCPRLRALRERLVAEAGCYVGNDSGVTHLAAALGVLTVAFFRATDPRIWRPLGRCDIRRGDAAGGHAA
jgi:ADP-heptose:LPS heptosyltransferase